ncbi:MAG: hypothetical protein J3K34DRAFT_396430, partial [Monoraphidium minutum]
MSRDAGEKTRLRVAAIFIVLAMACGVARAAVTTCAAGQTGNGYGGCQLCPQGNWSLGGNATTPQPPCTPCPAGQSTAGPGAKSRAACMPAGSDRTCSLQLPGSAVVYQITVVQERPWTQDLWDRLRGTPWAGASGTLEDWARASATANNCSALTELTWPYTGPTFIYTAGKPANYSLVTSIGGYGGYSANPANPIISTSSITTTPGANLLYAVAVLAPSTRLQICAAGTGYTASGCQLCQQGTWSIGGNTAVPQPGCSVCPSGTNTTGQGATSSAACRAPGNTNVTCRITVYGTAYNIVVVKGPAWSQALWDAMRAGAWQSSPDAFATASATAGNDCTAQVEQVWPWYGPCFASTSGKPADYSLVTSLSFYCGYSSGANNRVSATEDPRGSSFGRYSFALPA